MKSSDPDAMVTATYVILVTDGSPNCMEGGEDDDEGAVDATVAAVEALAKAGTPTYVLGYDTKNDAELSAALDRMAAAGGTGDTAHRAIEDEASLIQEFDEIGKTAVSCDYVLDRAAGDPAYVLVKLDGTAQKLGEDWSLSEDGRRVSLLGDACATLRGGGDSKLSVEVSCTVVNLL
jgi:hypothetical protein